MLVNMTDILRKSREGKYGVVTPNICNEDSARAAIEVAEEKRAPVILDLIFNVSPDIPLLAHHGELKRAHLGYALMAEGYKAKLAHYMELFGQCGKA